MSKLHRWAVGILAALLVSAPAAADPIKLDLAIAIGGATPASLTAWSEAVNADADGSIEIAVHNRDTPLGTDIRAQLNKLQDGESDIAHIFPVVYVEQFPGADVTYMPGLFDDAANASVAMWRLLEQGALEGFGDLHVLMAWTSVGSEVGFINTGFPVSGLETLRGKRIRVSANALHPLLEALGAEPVSLPISKTRAAIESGELDGLLSSTVPLFVWNLIEVTNHHVKVPVGAIWHTVAMKKDTYESLPDEAKAALAKHSGEGFVRAQVKREGESLPANLKKLQDTPDHVVRDLNSSEQQEWKIAEDATIEAWVREDPTRQKVLDAVRSELSKLAGS